MEDKQWQDKNYAIHNTDGHPNKGKTTYFRMYCFLVNENKKRYFT